MEVSGSTLRAILSLPPSPCPCIGGTHSGEDSDDGSVSNHPFSKPLLLIDVIWNLGFVFISVFVLLYTIREEPSSPNLRVWVFGYAMQSLLHVGFVYFIYQRGINYNPRSVLKRLESANTIASSFWWVFGFYCIVNGGQSLLQDSPGLYWLAVVYLALDVFFMILCLGIAFVVCVALFCCMPIFATAYAMTIREGASEDEISLLPKYSFHHTYAATLSAYTESTEKRALQFQVSECCICLNQYAEGAELCSLPCNHHFHFRCISRWLRINANCPLCKFNIKAKADTLV